MDARREEVLDLMREGHGPLFCKLRKPGRPLKVIDREEEEEVYIYSWLPGLKEGDVLNRLNLSKGGGERLNVMRRGSHIAGFLMSHNEDISYEVAVKDSSLLEDESIDVLASTPAGNIAAFAYEVGGGKIFFLPSELAGGEEFLEAVEKLLRDGLTPAPSWLEGYRISDEESVQSEINELDDQIEELQATRETKQKELYLLGAFKELLPVRTDFGLKKVLLRVLKRLDLNAEEGRSGIDLRVKSPDGSQFAVKVGTEVGGPVGVKPYHELVRGINDLKIYENDDPQGVLVVNGYADEDPKDRSKQFEKELEEGCKLYGFSLVKTDEIYEEMKKLENGAERKDKLVDMFRGS